MSGFWREMYPQERDMMIDALQKYNIHVDEEPVEKDRLKRMLDWARHDEFGVWCGE